MEPSRYRRLRELVHAAALRPAHERAAWLGAQAPDDVLLVAEALALLAEEGASTTGLLAAPPTTGAPPWSLPVGTRVGPYVLGPELGRGGMGVVHEAAIPGRAGSVALKLILPHLLGSESARERFRREARLGLSIDHPNVVRALDVGEASLEGRPVAWLAMERVRGRTFRELVASLGALPEAWVRELVMQAAEGLASLHAAGVVHRDLKPENLILTDDRRVRVMDLGVAKSIGSQGGLTAEGLFLGSPAYAAPEQCEGRPVGAAADLYALGAVLFELASGRPPFEAREALALLRAQVSERPPALEERNPTISPFLSCVAATLLNKRPEQRFSGAAVLAQTLREGEQGAWWSLHAMNTPRLTRRLGDPRALPLVGRERELEVLREAWREARGGRGGTLLLEAEAGLGSSRLVAELLDEAGRDVAVRCVHAACGDAAARPGPEEALVEALGSDARAPALAERLGLAAEAADALAAQLARLPLAAGRPPLPAASVDGLLTRLARSLARETPLLIVVEDLHAASVEQRRAVLALARAALEHPLLLVTSTRPDLDVGLRARFAALPGTQTLTLGRLGHDDLVRLFEAAVGDPGMARRLARVLGPRADGVPLFALEMLRDIRRRAAGASTPVAEVLTREATPPRALRDLIQARLAEVPPTLRYVLDAAAVVGRDVDPAILAAALARPRVEILEALGLLERRHALLLSGPRLFRFDLELVRETVEAEVPQALRAEIHDRIADALALAGDLEEGERAARVTSHRLRGARPPEARDTLASALAHLARSARFAERAALAQRALELPGLLERAGRFDRLLDLAADLSRLGQYDGERQALADAQALARSLGDRQRHGRALLQTGYLMLRTGEFEPLLELAPRARLLCAGDARTEAECVGLEGKALWCLGRYVEARARHEEALLLAARCATELPRARVRADLAIVLQEQGHLPDALAHQEAALRVLRHEGDRRNLAGAIGDTANTLLTMGRMADALLHFEEALGIARQDGLIGSEAGILINLAELHARVGRLERAREALETCLGLTQETGERRVEAYALHGLGRLACWRGDLAESARRFEAALALRRSMGGSSALAETLLELGQRDLLAGESTAARVHLEEALGVAGSIGEVNTLCLAHAALARLDPTHLAAALRAREAAGERLRMDTRLEVASLLWQAGGDPAELARARELLAQQLSLVPETWRTSLRTRVPYVSALPAV